MKLDENQELAVETIDGPIMIVSCAGSGKTTVLLEKINTIINHTQEPHRILAVTFSRAAAKEMDDRFQEKYGYDDVRFSTIHSICLSILIKYSSIKRDAVLKDNEKNIFTSSVFNKYIKNKSEFKDFEYEDFVSEINLYISQQMTNDYLGFDYIIPAKEVYSYIYDDYKKYKTKLEKIDFDDMLILCHQLLKSNQDILNELKNHYDYYLIDEFQDTNVIQAEIFYMLSSKTNNICVVGDDDQSIYGFRGADSQIFKNFKSNYPTAKVIYLNKNYRSLPFIIDGASKLIVNNKKRIEKKFFTNRIGSGRIVIDEKASLSDEIGNVIDEIMRLHSSGVAYNEIGILYRVNRLASGLVTLLEKENIPFYSSKIPKDIHEGMVFRDIEAYYNLASESGTRTDLLRIINRPSRYIKSGKLRNASLTKQGILNTLIKGEGEEYKKEGIIEKIDQLFNDLENLSKLNPTDFMDYLKFQMYYVDGLDDYAEFLNKKEHMWKDEFSILREESEDYKTFEEWQIDIIRRKKERRKKIQENKKKGVYLSTFHGAKGLQWKNVFIISANENVAPHFEAMELEKTENLSGIEEERRLFYVALTRAMDKLSISYNREGYFSKPSRFINELS